MLTKKQIEERKKVEQWMETANMNTLLSFRHMAANMSIDKKVTLEQAQVLAYRRMKKKGMIQG